MYNVLIVDDESAVFERFKLAISWEEFGLQIVGMASSGHITCRIQGKQQTVYQCGNKEIEY